MKNNELSYRLKTVADMVSPNSYVCDVGCDHGFLSISLVESGKSIGALAMDVRKGPLAAANEHILEAGLSERIETRLSDGIHELSAGEIEDWYKRGAVKTSLVIAGMGGPLILRILEECPDVRKAFDEIIISPQSQIYEVREGLPLLGLGIVDENMIVDENKYYTIIKLINGQGIYDCSGSDELYKRAALAYGPANIEKRPAALKNFLDYEYGILKKISENLDEVIHEERYETVHSQIEINRYVRKKID